MGNHRYWHHRETHLSGRAGWLRAMVLGSNDAIVSTASLMLGVAASSAPKQSILVAGVAGLVAGRVGYSDGRFFLATFVGKALRVRLVALLGGRLLPPA